MSQLIRRVYLPAEMSRDVVRDLEKVVRWINRRGCPTLRGKEGDLKRQLEQYLDQVNTSQTEEGAKASDDVPDVSQSDTKGEAIDSSSLLTKCDSRTVATFEIFLQAVKSALAYSSKAANVIHRPQFRGACFSPVRDI